MASASCSHDLEGEELDFLASDEEETEFEGFDVDEMPGGGGGGGYSMYPWLGRCGAAPHTLTLFKTNIADFPTHFKTESRFLIPC